MVNERREHQARLAMHGRVRRKFQTRLTHNYSVLMPF